MEHTETSEHPKFDGSHHFRASFNVARVYCSIGDLDRRFARGYATQNVLRTGTKWCKPASFGVGCRNVVHRREAHGVAINAENATELGIAEVDGILKRVMAI